MFDSTGNFYYGESLYHHGVKGMRWGVRRYQNPDGSLTAKGKMLQAKKDKKEALNRLNKHNSDLENYALRHPIKAFSPQVQKEYALKRGALESDFYDKEAKYKQAKKEYKATPEGKKESRKAVAKGAAMVSALVLTGVGLNAASKKYRRNGLKVVNGAMNRTVKVPKSTPGLDYITFKPETFGFKTFKPEGFKSASIKLSDMTIDDLKRMDLY